MLSDIMPTSKHLSTGFMLFFLLFLLSGGCSEEPETVAAKEHDHETGSCISCHKIELDDNHQLACTSCHSGQEGVMSREEAHEGLVARPAHPENAMKYCGGCHEKAIDMVAGSNHYTLSDHISLVRTAFGAKTSPDTPLLLKASAAPQNALELTDDLLRRRCLRCHVYGEGDDFSKVRRATGCAACHLAYDNGRMKSHAFLAKPDDSRCLSCHYGNHVGFDYYGRYEHDYNEEYRTPFRQKSIPVRPFGVEYHQLEPDVHQQAGMVCIDCHSSAQVMGSEQNSRTCRACHDPKELQNHLPQGVTRTTEQFTYSSAATGLSLTLPVIKNPAHLGMDKISCQACHARWSFNDGETHLMRIDHDDFDDFYRLSLDGSSEVKKIIGSHIDDDGDLLEPVMSDKFTGQEMAGIWLKGFSERRWERLILLRDNNGVITTGRPILDLSLSWIDRDEKVRFDNIRPLPGTKITRPYTPHTIGAAGLYYQERLNRFVKPPEQSTSTGSK